MAYRDPERKRAYHRQYMAERRELLVRLGLCSECGREDAYTMAGRRRCFECSASRRKTPVEYIRPEKAPTENRRRQPGRCHICGGPVMEGLTKWGGEPIRLCRKHYEALCRAGEKGRERYREKEGETWGQTQFRLSQRVRKSDVTARSSPRPE